MNSIKHDAVMHHADNGHHDKQQLSVEEAAKRFLGKREELEIDKLFKALVKLEGSDLHLKAGRPPFVRVKGSPETSQPRSDRR